MPSKRNDKGNWTRTALKHLDKMASSVATADAGQLDTEALLRNLSAVTAAAGDGQRADVAGMAREIEERWRGVNPGVDDVSRAIENLRRAVERQGGPAETARANEPPKSPEPEHHGEIAANAASLAQDPELVADFVGESREHLDTIELHLLAVEENPSNTDALNAMFRSFHSVKGLAGFLGFERIEEVAHDAENMLDKARNRELSITPDVADVILAARDFLTRTIDQVESVLNGAPPENDLDSAPLLARIGAVLRGEGAGAQPVQDSKEDAPQRRKRSRRKVDCSRRTRASSAAPRP